MRSKKFLLYNQSILRIPQFILYTSLILYFGREIFIPLSFALLISFVLYPICQWLEKKGFGKLGAIIISLSFLIILITLICILLISQIMAFFKEWPSLQNKLAFSFHEVSQFIIDKLEITKEQQSDWLSRLANEAGASILHFMQNVISISATSTVIIVLIPIYSVLILYYREHWMKVIYRLFPKEKKSELHSVISLTVKTYYNFIKGMGLVYLAVGILNSIGLLIIGIPHAILFGFITSILTFIPYIGILVGALLPITIAWITYDSVWYPIAVIVVFIIVQYLEANVIFPLAVSQRLKVNALTMLLVIFVGGILWGVAGMILFVPFVGIAKLIADHNPRWKTISMILGMEPN